MQQAQKLIIHMITNNYWVHYAPDGTTPWLFIVSSGYQYKTAGENLAKGFDTSSGVVAGWMESPTHKANVLGDYTDVGFAVTNGILMGSETTLIVAMYGTKNLPVSIPKVLGKSEVFETFNLSILITSLILPTIVMLSVLISRKDRYSHRHIWFRKQSTTV